MKAKFLKANGEVIEIEPKNGNPSKVVLASFREIRGHYESDPFAKVVNDTQALGHYVETELVKLYFQSLYDRGQNLTI